MIRVAVFVVGVCGVVTCKKPVLPSGCSGDTVGVQACGYCTAEGECMEPKTECVPRCSEDADCPDQAFRGCDASTHGCVPRDGACGSNM
jgi:hypothetical protein